MSNLANGLHALWPHSACPHCHRERATTLPPVLKPQDNTHLISQHKAILLRTYGKDPAMTSQGT